MGYYTRYDLTVKTENFSENTVIKKFREECEDAEYCLNDDGCSVAETTWYEHEADLRKFSEKFPDNLFTLHGEGEESTDMWNLYVKNGKSQLEIAKIVIEPFDESKLE